MTPHQFMILVMTGCALIVFGLIPGFFERLAEAIEDFRDSVVLGVPGRPPRCAEYHRPLWLTGIGAGVLVVSILAHFSN